ncbi:hypothetical protein NC652_003739 [Populus alba x Populus x berolinensis]|nr:hypothetical protein NC652_003737 [Populus alba x Populus x berolinensis]KAJ6965947.1 hypothetical protein NC652_003739 [Populus alba x Populus x berolinensis]
MNHLNCSKRETKPTSRIRINDLKYITLFGSQLKIQIPPFPLSFLLPTYQSPKSLGEFRIKKRNSRLGSFSSGFSPSLVKKSLFESTNFGMETPNSPQVFFGCLSISEIKLSKNYTCVITHEPVRRTTHIFYNCMVKSCCGVVGFFTSLKKDNNRFLGNESSYLPNSFLTFCFA